MEKTACYPFFMQRRRVTRAAAIPLIAAALGAVLSLQSCSAPRLSHEAGGVVDRAELSELFGLLKEAGPDPVHRFAVLRQISSNLIRQREFGRLAALLTSLEGFNEAGNPADAAADSGGAWYLFTAAYAYEQAGSAPIAAIYYDRALEGWPDYTIDDRSIHRECLSRLIAIVDTPERRIDYYKDLIARFPEEANDGTTLFLLAKEYERVGDWELAIRTYSEFLPFFGTAIPGYPDAFNYARGLVDLYNSPKDWVFQDLQTLVGKIKAALAAGDSYKLRSYRAKVNFFASGWHGDEADSNARALFDFGEFTSSSRISAAPELDPSSNRHEAYLKTWGWTDKISIWYLCFRKVYFPADPDIHGDWEWAGIYLGEKTQ
jgi:tetratricopeptide (TPR) repeat protein